VSCDYDDVEFDRAVRQAEAQARRARIAKALVEEDDCEFDKLHPLDEARIRKELGEAQPKPAGVAESQVERIARGDGSRYGADPPEACPRCGVMIYAGDLIRPCVDLQYYWEHVDCLHPCREHTRCLRCGAQHSVTDACEEA
jgi:hypothetical protein